MPLNPLDWTGGPFLVLYIVLVGAVVLVCQRLRMSIGPDQARSTPLGALQIAYLADGPTRVADSALVGLLTSNAATLRDRGQKIEIHADGHAAPEELQPIARTLHPGVITRSALRSSLSQHINLIRKELQRCGLTPSDERIARYRWQIAACFLVPIVLGIAKLGVGHARHKPIGILSVLVIATAVVGIWSLRRPYRTKAGAAALAASQATHARLARAPRDNELFLATALGGLVVLSGTHWAAASAAPAGEAAAAVAGDRIQLRAIDVRARTGRTIRSATAKWASSCRRSSACTATLQRVHLVG